MKLKICESFLNGYLFNLHSLPDVRMYQLAFCCVDPILREFKSKNVKLTPCEAEELHSAIKIYFYSIYSKQNKIQQYDRYEESSLIFKGLRYFYDFEKYVSSYLYGPHCCGEDFICGRTHCIKSQILLFAKSVLKDFVEVTGRNLPRSLQGIKGSFSYNKSCPICLEED